MTNYSRKISNAISQFSLKSLILFLVAMGAVLYAYVLFYTPFREIPLLASLVNGDMAYQTPALLVNTYFSLFIILSSFASVFFILFAMKKYWK